MAEVRQRNTAKKPESSPSAASLAQAEDKSSFSFLDLARGLVLLAILSSATSYFVTGSSFTWNVERPQWTQPGAIQAWLVSAIPLYSPLINPTSILFPYRTPINSTQSLTQLLHQNGPHQYTTAELRAYDGSDPEKPILLAINGTVYDVSAGSKHYGPGGAYHFFAGAHATRAFVTNCFKEDITADMVCPCPSYLPSSPSISLPKPIPKTNTQKLTSLPPQRGAETLFLPRDDPAIDNLYTKGQLKALKEQERRRARESAHAALKHWTDFFATSRYPRVGDVKPDPELEKGPLRALCPAAEDKRPVRRAPGEL